MTGPGVFTILHRTWEFDQMWDQNVGVVRMHRDNESRIRRIRVFSKFNTLVEKEKENGKIMLMRKNQDGTKEIMAEHEPTDCDMLISTTNQEIIEHGKVIKMNEINDCS